MGLRLLGYEQPNSSNVMPLHGRESKHGLTTDEAGNNGVSRAVEVGGGSSPRPVPVPEPIRLYHLTVLAFLVHIPEQGGSCAGCDARWPCTQVRLAFRLREGF